MFEQELLLPILYFIIGFVVGIAATLLFNKARTGTASAHKLKKEMEDYQGQVEQHFEQTSKKFKDMTEQYQDLYQHLSVGATTLCRPDNIAPGLSDSSAPVAKIEASVVKEQAPADVKEQAPADKEQAQSEKEAPAASIDKKASVAKAPEAGQAPAAEKAPAAKADTKESPVPKDKK